MPAFHVLSVSPSDHAHTVSVTPTLTLVWERDLDAGTVSSHPWTLVNTSTQTSTALGAPAVERAQCSLALTDPLDPMTTYTVIVPAGIQDILGNTLPSPFIWTFTTGTSSALATPQILTPEAFADVTTLTVSVSAVDSATDYELQISSVRGFSPCITRILVKDPDDVDVESGAIDDASLTSGTYFLRVRARASSSLSAWSPVTEVSYKLPLSADNAEIPYGTIWSAPAQSFYVIRVTPPPGACLVSPEACTVLFSKRLHPNTLTPGTPQYAPPRMESLPIFGGAPVDIALSSWSINAEDTRQLICTGPFEQNTTYQVYLSPNTTAIDNDPLVGE